MSVRILIGDCREKLRELEDESVHCVVTSPPYWGLRDYGTGTWEGGDPACSHTRNNPREDHSRGEFFGTRGAQASTAAAATPMRETCSMCGAARVDRQMGLEATPDDFVAGMVEVFREVRRVLRGDGTLWLNIGDSYATAPYADTHTFDPKYAGRNRTEGYPNRQRIAGIKHKDMVGIPWALAFGLRADGWHLRQEIIWHKANPMPESAKDRCTKAHEQLFLLTKSAKYYFDADAISEECSPNTHARYAQAKARGEIFAPTNWARGDEPRTARDLSGQRAPRNNGVGWGHGYDQNPKPRTKGRKRAEDGSGTKSNASFYEGTADLTERRNKRSVWTVPTAPFSEAHFATFPPALIEPCVLAGCPEGGTVLDPFGGAGTTGLVADRHHRDAILIELNPTYAEMARRRIHGDAPLFSEATCA